MAIIITIQKWWVNKSFKLAICYFSVIPIFACIYYFSLPNDFYHPNLKFEKNFILDEKYLINEITQQIIKTIRNANGDKKPIYRQDILETDKILIIYSEVNGKELTLETRVTLSHPSGTSFFKYITIKLPLYDELSPFYLIYDESMDSSLHNDRLLRVKIEDLSRYDDKKQLIEIIFPTSHPFDALVMPINDKLDKMIINYYKGLQGNACNISGNFMRMFYFSTVTITTLGYGDIVPLSTAARTWVSIESILGMVLIGLFLNSLKKPKPIN
jgi:hypothetical protein